MVAKPLRVLIVDDDPTFVDYLAFFLSKQGCRVFTAFEGEEALRKIDELHPDLVILDVVLPGLGGFETLELIKAGRPELPVVMLTCHDSHEAAQATRLGADGFIRKPWLDGKFEEVLEATVQSYTRKKETRTRGDGS